MALGDVSDLLVYTLFGISALAEGSIDSRSCVRACVRPRRDIWRSALQIILKLGTKFHLGETKKNDPSGFLKKILVGPPGGGFTPKMSHFS